VRSRLLAVVLIAAAALLDAAGVHGTAYLVLVLAVPVSAAAALIALGDVLAASGPAPAERVRTALGAIVVGLVLFAAASRAPFVTAGEVPPVAAAALVCCLVVLALDALVAGCGLLSRARPLLRIARS
jgi:hypothetical protein